MATTFADRELLSLHELLMDTALSVKEIRNHLGQINDPELRRLAETCLDGKRTFVQEAASILK